MFEFSVVSLWYISTKCLHEIWPFHKQSEGKKWEVLFSLLLFYNADHPVNGQENNCCILLFEETLCVYCEWWEAEFEIQLNKSNTKVPLNSSC